MKVFKVILKGDIEATVVSENEIIHGQQTIDTLSSILYVQAKTEEEALEQYTITIAAFIGDSETRVIPVGKEHLQSVVQMYKKWADNHSLSDDQHADISQEHCLNYADMIERYIEELDE